MIAHLRANLLLLVLTLLLGSVAYPLVLWAIAWGLFPSSAGGSLIDADGKPTNDPEKAVGSRLIGQSFSDPKFFHPRPSNAGSGYDASASGATNYGASNPKLRGHAAQALGTVARFKDSGDPVGPKVVLWFKESPDRTRAWAEQYPTLADDWAGNNKDAVTAYLHLEKFPDDDPGKTFFTAFVAENPGKWPGIVKEKVKPEGGGDETEVARVKPIDEGDEIAGYFFDMWLQDPKVRESNIAEALEPVPADMVTASGSGLDPHITLRNARYQAPAVAAAWVEETKANPAAVRKAVDAVVNAAAFRPMNGVAGDESLVNVLELNLALKARMAKFAKK